jgi:trehalose 6-phosphate synthase
MTAHVTDRPVIIASNRGPLSFERGPDGILTPRRGGGGLVTALTGALQGSGGFWVASAMSEEDRELAGRGWLDLDADGARFRLRFLAFPPAQFDRFYNGISNRILWFVNHYLWDIPRTPRFGDRVLRDWRAYRRVNEAFADALCEEGQDSSLEPAYLIQDYHLSLVPAMLRERRPQSLINHFSHIPFAGPSYLKILPAVMREELLTGLLGADVVGFQADAWADNFLMACRTQSGARVDFERRRVQWRGREVLVRTYPVSVDADALDAFASTEEVARATRRITRWRGDEKLILRVDRTELSKNILRGFLAYETFLRHRPRWRGKVRFLALFNSSRGAIAEYRRYMNECVATARRINAELGTPGWQPILWVVGDDFSLVVAAYGLYDALVVNPVYDGLNLIAKEGPLVNRQDGVLILSENAGAFSELGKHALGVNPFDVGATADAIGRALTMPTQERAQRAQGLRRAVLRNTPEDWVGRQLDDLASVRPRRRATG